MDKLINPLINKLYGINIPNQFNGIYYLDTKNIYTNTIIDNK